MARRPRRVPNEEAGVARSRLRTTMFSLAARDRRAAVR